jgi:hypothetical protein
VKSRNTLAALVAASALALTAAPASAQFTTFVPPKKAPVADTAAPQVAAEQRADSAQKQTLTDMKVWVDSAARALAVNVDTTAVDSLVVDSLAGEVVQSGAESTPTTEFREGAPAPDTATMFPILAAAALGCLGAGAFLLRRGGA